MILDIHDCKEIIKRENNKTKDSLWYFFWGVMENDIDSATKAAKECKGYKRALIKKAKRLLDAHQEMKYTVDALAKYSEKQNG